MIKFAHTQPKHEGDQVNVNVKIGTLFIYLCFPQYTIGVMGFIGKENHHRKQF